ncbi:hypothetical protein [Endozoicomonas arenosclerae]|uniref:hypothetical protein n=1 Tax=Endozoicomonas arenosclerae TaxID=1633495 RepID=UPI000781D098|nr:hypothetical protein [Endozoicomonas arenosclerae]
MVVINGGEHCPECEPEEFAHVAVADSVFTPPRVQSPNMSELNYVPCTNPYYQNIHGLLSENILAVGSFSDIEAKASRLQAVEQYELSMALDYICKGMKILLLALQAGFTRTDREWSHAGTLQKWINQNVDKLQFIEGFQLSTEGDEALAYQFSLTASPHQETFEASNQAMRRETYGSVGHIVYTDSEGSVVGVVTFGLYNHMVYLYFNGSVLQIQRNQFLAALIEMLKTQGTQSRDGARLHFFMRR